MLRLTWALFDLPLKDRFSCSIEVLAIVASCCATQTDDRLFPGRCPPSAGNNQQMRITAFNLPVFLPNNILNLTRHQTAINTMQLYLDNSRHFGFSLLLLFALSLKTRGLYFHKSMMHMAWVLICGHFMVRDRRYTCIAAVCPI